MMPEELPNLGVEPLPPPPIHSVRASERNRVKTAYTPEQARDLYPHLFASPKFADWFDRRAPDLTPEQIGSGILRFDAAWRRWRRKHLEKKYASLPINDRREIVTRLITEETTPPRPKENALFGTLREARTGGADVAESAVNKLARGMLSLLGDEPPEAPLAELPTLQGLVRGAGAELPLIPAYALGGAGLGALAGRGAAAGAGAIPRAAAALLRASGSGSLPARAAAGVGVATALEAPVAPLATATTPEGMDETVLQRLLMAGAFGGAAPVAGAAARGLIGAAERGLARAVPVRQLDVSGLAPRPLQAAEAEEIAEAIARLRNRSGAPTSPGRPPPEGTVRQRGAGFETTSAARSPVTVREGPPATGAAREALLQPQRPVREITVNERVADLMPSERSLAEAIHAQGLDPTTPGAPAFPETVTIPGRPTLPVPERPPIRPGTTPPFDAGRVVLPTDTPEVAAQVREAAEAHYQKIYNGFRAGGVSPRESAHRATQAAEKRARLVRQDAEKIARLSVEIPADEAAAQAARPGVTAAAKAARAAGGREAVAILGRTVTPQSGRTLGQKKRALARALERMAARLEGEADVPKARTPRPPGPMGRVRNLEKRLEQDRVDRILQEYMSPSDAAPPPPPDPPMPGQRVGAPPPPPPDSPNFIDPAVDDVVKKVAAAIETNRLGLSATGKLKHWFLTSAYRYRRQPELVAAMRELAGEAYIRSQLNARKAMFALEKAAERDPTKMHATYRALSGDAPINQLPAQMQEHAQRIRNYIDDLSRQIQEELQKLGTPQALGRVDVIEAHLGRYLRRQYARDLLGDKWKSPDGALNDAARWLIENDDFGKSEAEIAGALYKMVMGDNDVSIAGRKFGRLNRSIMLHRKDIPEPIRKAMGEVQSAPAVVAMTIAQQERYLATLKFHRRIAEAGLVSDVLDPARGFTAPLPQSEGLGALSGKWTTPEIFEALAETTARQERAHEMLNFWTGLWKSGKILAPAPILRNFTSNAWFAALSGSLRVNLVGQAIDLFYRAPRLLLEHATAPVGASHGVVDEMYRHGIIGTEFGAREVQQELSDLVRVGVEFANGTTTAGWRKFGHIVREYGARASKVYDLMDKLWKVDAYVKAKAKIAKKLPGISNDELAARAAAHVNRYFPNYELLSEGVKQMRRLPLAFNPFLSFNAEVVRIHAGMLQRAFTGDRDSWRAIMTGAGWLGGLYALHRTWRWMDGINAAESGAMADALMGDPFGRVTPQAETKAKRAMRSARLAQRPFMFALSRRDEQGRVEFADLTWHLPWGQFFAGYPEEHLPAKALRWAAESFINPEWTDMVTEPFVESMGPDGGVRPGSGTEAIWRVVEPRAVLGARRIAEMIGGPGTAHSPGIAPPPFGRGEQLTPRQVLMGEMGVPLAPVGRVEQRMKNVQQRQMQMEPRRVNRRLGRDERFTDEQRKAEVERAKKRARLQRMR